MAAALDARVSGFLTAMEVPEEAFAELFELKETHANPSAEEQAAVRAQMEAADGLEAQVRVILMKIKAKVIEQGREVNPPTDEGRAKFRAAMRDAFGADKLTEEADVRAMADACTMFAVFKMSQQA